MAVPAHDTRDWEFAKKFDLPIIEVVKGGNVQEEAYTDCATGIMVNSGMLDGLTVDEAKKKIISWLESEGKGHSKVNYKLRDWVFSRQRYWGEPIPIVHCDKCGYVPIDESELPLRLPMVESYEPTDNGESPLAKMTDWLETTCPCCGGKAMRETDTMPQWAGSSWYFLRYMDPHNDKALASKEAINQSWSARSQRIRGSAGRAAQRPGQTLRRRHPAAQCRQPASGGWPRRSICPFRVRPARR